MGAASAILGIATAGVQCSIKLVIFAGQVESAEEEITHLAENVSLNANILQQLGDLVQDGEEAGRTTSQDTDDDHEEGPSNVPQSRAIFNETGLAAVIHLAEMCKAIFHTLNESIHRASARSIPNTGTSGPVKLTRLATLKWPFLKPETEALQTQLRDVKGTLMLMLQLAMLRRSRKQAEWGSNEHPIGVSHLTQADQRLLIVSIGLSHKKQQETTRPSSEDTKVDDAPDRDRPFHSLPPANETRAFDHSPVEKRCNLLSKFCNRFLHARSNDVRADEASAEGSSECNSMREAPIGHPNLSAQESDFQAPDIDQQSFASLPVAQPYPDAQDDIGLFVKEAKANVQYLAPPKKEPAQSESQHERVETSMKDFLEVRVFSPVACIKDRKIHVEYVHRAIQISQQAAEHQLAAWKSTSNDSVLNQLLALSTSEHEALEGSSFSSNDHSELPGDALEWLQFGESLPLVDDVAHVRARTLTAVVKVSRGPQGDRRHADHAEKDKDEQTDTWTKVPRQYLRPETLNQYDLPWMEDVDDPKCIIIKKLVSEATQEELFAHTHRIHKEAFGTPDSRQRAQRFEQSATADERSFFSKHELRRESRKSQKKSRSSADWNPEHTGDNPRPNPEIILQSDIDNGESFEGIVDGLLARYTNA